MDKKVIYQSSWKYGIPSFSAIEVIERLKTYKVISVTDIVGGWYSGRVIRKSDPSIFTDRQVALDTLIEDGYEIVKGLERERLKTFDAITNLKQLAGRK